MGWGLDENWMRFGRDLTKKRVRSGLELDENWMNIAAKCDETRCSGIGFGTSLYVQAKSLGATIGIYNSQLYGIKTIKKRKMKKKKGKKRGKTRNRA